MHPTFRVGRRTLAGLLCCGLTWCGAVQAGQQPQFPTAAAQPQGGAAAQPAAQEKPSRREWVPIGGSREIRASTGKALKSVRNEKDQIVSVMPGPVANGVIVTGLAAGTSRLTLTDQDNRTEVVEVVVQLDVDFLRTLLERAVPTANVRIIPGANNTLVLSGHVARAEDVDVITQLANSVLPAIRGQTMNRVINALTVGGVQQVQLDVTVAQVNRTEARNRGFNFAVNGRTVSLGSFIGSLTSSGAQQAQPGGGGVGVFPGIASFLPSTVTPTGAQIVFGIVPSQFQSLLQALRQEGLSKLLAEPKLITLSGRPAHFLAGGRQAVLSPSSGINGPGVTYEEIGTELDFLPIVMGDGKIYLEVLPRVRQVDNGLGINTSFGFVPGFDEQTVRTAVLMEPEQTLAIGGLIQNITTAASNKIPVLGDLPFIGAAFSTITHNEMEQELVILVTPHLIDPMDCNQVNKKLPGRETRSPSDFELYLEGLLEAPRGPRQPFQNKRYVAAWKNDPSVSQFPCGTGNCGTGQCATGNCGTMASAPTLTAPMAANQAMPQQQAVETIPTAAGPTNPVLPPTPEVPAAAVVPAQPETATPTQPEAAVPTQTVPPAAPDAPAQPLPRLTGEQPPRN